MIAFSIALGGAFGALVRFLVNQLMIANGLGAVGLSTLTINVTGSFAIGCCFVIFERFNASDALRLVDGWLSWRVYNLFHLFLRAC